MLLGSEDMSWLLYILIAYLTGCYLWGMYLVVRLYTGKRLRVLLMPNRRATLRSKPASSAVEPAFAAAPPDAEPAAAPRRKVAA